VLCCLGLCSEDFSGEQPVKVFHPAQHKILDLSQASIHSSSIRLEKFLTDFIQSTLSLFAPETSPFEFWSVYCCHRRDASASGRISSGRPPRAAALPRSL